MTVEMQNLEIRAKSAAARATMGVEMKVRISPNTVFRGKVVSCEFARIDVAGRSMTAIFKVILRAFNGNEKVVHVQRIPA